MRPEWSFAFTKHSLIQNEEMEKILKKITKKDPIPFLDTVWRRCNEQQIFEYNQNAIKQRQSSENALNFKSCEQNNSKAEAEQTNQNNAIKNTISTHTLFPENFDKNIKQLYTSYKEFLQARQNKIQLASTNPFYSLLNTSWVIPSLKEGLLPLAFPNQLIEEILKKLGKYSHLFQIRSDSTLVFYYDFSESIQNGPRTVSIVVQHSDGRVGTTYARCKLFGLDTLTLTALNGFIEETNTDKPSLELQDSRNLIYAMYCGQIKENKNVSSSSDNSKNHTQNVCGLTMPGLDTEFITEANIIFPCEYPFDGFYQLLEKKQGYWGTFQAHEYTDQQKQFPDTKSVELDLDMAPESTQLIKEHHDAIQAEYFRNTAKRGMLWQNYEKQYQRTLALCHLHTQNVKKSNTEGDTFDRRYQSLVSLKQSFTNAKFPEPNSINFHKLDNLIPNLDLVKLSINSQEKSKKNTQLQAVTKALETLKAEWEQLI